MVIWKYMFDIADVVTLDAPRGARALHVDVQRGVPCIWMLCDRAQAREQRQFRVISTGHPIDDVESLRHIGTFQMPPFVWHVFEVAAPTPAKET
jgi:hypothetical protein